MSSAETSSSTLDVFATPLSGQQTIEASAGTGKTWTITSLYLRLLLEAGLTVEQILVVTYTVAATAELRTRIYQRLVETRDAFLLGSTDDPFCQELLQRYATGQRAVLGRVVNALRSFDEAAVFTIHGFCQRVLSESAFEACGPFRAELVADQSELIEECVQDFWRSEVYTASPLLVDYLLAKGIGLEALRAAIQPHVGKPFLRLLVPNAPPLAELEARYATAYRDARAILRASRDEIHALLGDKKRVRPRSYRRDLIARWLGQAADNLEKKRPHLALVEQLARLTTRVVNDAAVDPENLPTHPFFDACQTLLDTRSELSNAYGRQIQWLHARLLQYCDQQLRQRKRKRGLLYFDDLLIELQRALDAPGTAHLAETIRERFPAALVDEFQDTDPVQYAIFRRVYGGQTNPLFLVGDPKQAIYKFRGADVFSYLEARRDALTVHSLDANWRSDPPLIDAVNALFTAQSLPFVLEGIPFHEARPAERRRSEVALPNPANTAFRIWFLRRADGEARIDKETAEERAAEVTAVEIARLLDAGAKGEARIGGNRLTGGDIAVLVRTHDQGRRVRRALALRGVAAVQLAPESVFATQQAADLERLLMAIAEPGRERLVRAALVTELLGFTGERLHALGESENEWEDELVFFRDCRRRWLDDGLAPMLRRLLLDRQVPPRLLALPDGERLLTNLLQLTELLADHAERGAGSEKLIEWLATRRRYAHDERSKIDEHLLRLESDEQLVQVSTVHNSKGLEYAVVFCPFAWDLTGREERGEPISFHDPRHDFEPTLDFGRQLEESRGCALRESLAESLRLLYVALTRARHHCTMVWGAVPKADLSALAWLLHRHPSSDASDLDQVRAGLVQHLAAASDADLLADLERIAKRARGGIAIEPIAPPDGGATRVTASIRDGKGERALVPRVVRQPVKRTWWITSFSQLKAGRATEIGDYDARTLPMKVDSSPTLDAFGFPRGARAGICLHRIFEKLDFSAATPEVTDGLARVTLHDHGWGEEWVPVVSRLVADVLATPLDAAGTLRLGGLTRDRRLDEVEFHYPAARLTLDTLNSLLVEHGFAPLRERPGEPVPSPLALGYVKGFIDLVFEAGGRFYIADYKSNWLGPTIDTYGAEHLPAVMQRELYTLQYLTYTLAVDRLLRLRVPGYDYEQHFGGAYYLFVRGMRPALGPRSGVYFDRPARALIEAFDARLRGRSETRSASVRREGAATWRFPESSR